MTITCLIMAGGKGERFWPRSRASLPKQFLNIAGSQSMIQQTVSRLQTFIPTNQIFVVTNELYAELIKIQLPELMDQNIIIEPVGKNTAPCIGLASIIIEEQFPASSMIVIPSDHSIKNEEEFINILQTAVQLTDAGDKIATLGIKPDYAETGYGYIESSIEVLSINNMLVHRVKRFVEKPNAQKAEEFLKQGGFYWNSGIFVWKTSLLRSHIKDLMPDMHDLLETMKVAFKTEPRDEVIKKEFPKMPEQSIDFGIMEKVDNIYVIPSVLGWDDVGSWTALERINEQDENGNVIKGTTLSVDTKRCIIESNGRLIATLGVEDLIIVETEDVTFICKKDKAQEVKSLIKEMKIQKLDKYL